MKQFLLLFLCLPVYAQTTKPPVDSHVIKSQEQPVKNTPKQTMALPTNGKLKASTPFGAVLGGVCPSGSLPNGNDTYGRPICLPVTGVITTTTSSPSLSVTGNGSALTVTLNLNPTTGGSSSGNNSNGTPTSLTLLDTADGNCYAVTTSNGTLSDTQTTNCTGAVAALLLTDLATSQIYSLTTNHGILQNTLSSGSGIASIIVADASGGSSTISSQNGILQTLH